MSGLLAFLEPFEPLVEAVDAPADRPDLVEDRRFGGSDAAADLVGEDVEAAVLGVEVAGHAAAELAEHGAQVVVGHPATMPELQGWEYVG